VAREKNTSKVSQQSRLVPLRSGQGVALIAATVFASMAGFLDATVVNVAVPAIANDLGASLVGPSVEVLNWSGLPVVHVRPTVFLDSPLFTTLAARSIADSGTIRLPFGTGRTSPIATDDVARVVATILTDPGPYIGGVFELTGPRSQDMNGVAEEYARALGRPVAYVDIPSDTWAKQVLSRAGLGPYVDEHIATMARLHRENRYDRVTPTVEEITGRPAESVEEFIARQKDLFAE
jgi:uncharacterized protein YbjT (DUF2867 family)